MNKFVLGALALTAASTPSLAGTDDWSVTNRDLEAFSKSVAPAASGASVSGYLRSSYANSGDFAAGGNDLGGFSIDDARLNFTGGIANFSLVIEAEASTDPDQGVFGAVGGAGAVGILDAYAKWAVTDELNVQLGQFRPPFLASSMRSDMNLLFIDRSLLGNAWYVRNWGAELSGSYQMVNFMVAVMNGVDGAGDDNAFCGRVEVTPMGTASAHEGALGATEDPSLTVGLGYHKDDGTVDDRVAMGLDANFTVGIFSASAELVDYDKGWTALGSTGELTIPAATIADATPWNVSVGVIAIPDQCEVALRYEDLDDDDNTTVLTLGANWYLQGHAAKWQLNYSAADSDNAAQDGDVIQIGLTVGI